MILNARGQTQPAFRSPGLTQQYLLGRVDYNTGSTVINEEGFLLAREEIVFGYFGNSRQVEEMMATYSGYRTPVSNSADEYDVKLGADIIAALIKYMQHIDTGDDKPITNLLHSLGAASSWIAFRDDDFTSRSIIYRKVFF